MNRLMIFLSLCTVLVLISVSAFSQKEPAQGKIAVVPVYGVIDLGLSSFIQRVYRECVKQAVDTVILDIDTFGGRVDAAFQICDVIEGHRKIHTIAYISGEAWSAGALISLACKRIYMKEGSSIGSAEPRQGSGGEETTDEKLISALRSKFRAVADANGHSGKLAEAMVDKDVELWLVEVDGKKQVLYKKELEAKGKAFKLKFKPVILVGKGKLLNLTHKEALELGLADGVVKDRKELFDKLRISPEGVIEEKITWSENLVRFITHPIVSSLLLTLGFFGLLFELKMPGWGISGTLGVIAIGLFFWGHYLAGLASWTELLILAAGILLLALEIFVLPGFGIAGVAGIILILLGIVLTLIEHPFEIPFYKATNLLYTIGYTLIFIFVGLIILARYLPRSSFWRKRIVLTQREHVEQGYVSIPQEDIGGLIGKVGKAISALRPAGKIEIDGKVYDASSEDEFIESGEEVVVRNTEGGRIKVVRARG